MNTSYLVCLPHKFDILSQGITPDELRAAGLGLDEIFEAMDILKVEGNLDSSSTGYQFLLNKLVKYIVFGFDTTDMAMYLLTDAAKCRLAGLLIQEGLCEESQPSSLIADEYSIPDMLSALDEAIKRNSPSP
jgi:hypothetical protein